MISPGVLRPLATCDREVLRTATLLNMNWTGEQRFTYQDIDTAPDLRHYCSFVPSRGDFGFVAARDGQVTLGVVWLLFLDSHDPGYGFVADGVPELSIAVWTGYRGHGLGKTLMLSALREAADRGITRVSLSVEDGNPAVGLYRGVGFTPAEGGPAGTWTATPSLSA